MMTYAMTGNKMVDLLKNEFDSSLRTISIAEDQYQILYLRDDIEDLYSQEEIDNMWDEFQSDRLASLHFEDLYCAGDHYYTIQGFEEMINLHLMFDEVELILSFDNDLDTDVTAIVSTCEDLMESHTS